MVLVVGDNINCRRWHLSGRFLRPAYMVTSESARYSTQSTLSLCSLKNRLWYAAITDFLLINIKCADI